MSVKAKRLLLFLASAISSVAMAGKCPSCGQTTRDTDNFCAYCLADLRVAKTVPAPAPVAVSAPLWYGGRQVQFTPVQLGVFGPDFAVPPGVHYSVHGVVFNPLFADVANVYGLEMGGLTVVANNDMWGVQFAGVAANGGEVCGVQFAGLGAEITKNTTGIQFGGLFSETQHDMTGVQFGGVYADTKGKMVGAQFGCFGIAKSMFGVQLCLCNIATDAQGLQFGVINYARRMTSGVQVGVINVIENSNVPFFPIVNWKF